MEEVDSDTLKENNKVIAKNLLICLEVGGMNVFDYVGGIDCFAEFLRTIHESDEENKEKNKKNGLAILHGHEEIKSLIL